MDYGSKVRFRKSRMNYIIRRLFPFSAEMCRAAFFHNRSIRASSINFSIKILPIPDPRKSSRTNSRFISQIFSSNFLSAIHPASFSSAKAKKSRPSGGAYLPGRFSTSSSKF